MRSGPPLKLTVDNAVKDLDRLQYFLDRRKVGFSIITKTFAIDPLKKANMEKCKAISAPMMI